MNVIRRKYHKALDRVDYDKMTPENYVDQGTISGCLGNTAEHWPDILLHFYCQLGQARACYTGFIRDQAAQIQTLPDPREKIARLATLRYDTFNHCVKTAKDTPDSQIPQLPENKQREVIEWRWIADTTFDVDTGAPCQLGAQGCYSMAHIYEYVMMAPTFQFGMEHEQLVLNAFYRVADPDNAGKCTEARPARAIDVQDQNANYCVATKNHDPRLGAKGR